MKKKGARMDLIEQEIAALEELEKQQIIEIRQTALQVVHGLSPVTLLRDSIRKVTASPGLRHPIMITALGIGAGILGKKLFTGRSNNLFKKAGGLAFEFLVSNFVRNKVPQFIKKDTVTTAAD